MNRRGGHYYHSKFLFSQDLLILILWEDLNFYCYTNRDRDEVMLMDRDIDKCSANRQPLPTWWQRIKFHLISFVTVQPHIRPIIFSFLLFFSYKYSLVIFVLLLFWLIVFNETSAKKRKLKFINLNKKMVLVNHKEIMVTDN